MITSIRAYEAAREVLESLLQSGAAEGDERLRVVSIHVHRWEHERFHQRFPQRDEWWVDVTAATAGDQPTKAWHPTYARWRRALDRRRLVPKRRPAAPLRHEADYRAARVRADQLWTDFSRAAIDEQATLLWRISHYEAHHRPRAPLHTIKHAATGGLWKPERFQAT